MREGGTGRLSGEGRPHPAVSGAVSHDVGGTQAFGALRALEFDGLAFVQRPVARILNRGKVNEDIFAAGPLDEPIPLRSVKPLHHTMLFHWDSFNCLRPVIASSETDPAVSGDVTDVTARRDTKSCPARSVAAGAA